MTKQLAVASVHRGDPVQIDQRIEGKEHPMQVFSHFGSYG